MTWSTPKVSALCLFKAAATPAVPQKRSKKQGRTSSSADNCVCFGNAECIEPLFKSGCSKLKGGHCGRILASLLSIDSGRQDKDSFEPPSANVPSEVGPLLFPDDALADCRTVAASSLLFGPSQAAECFVSMSLKSFWLSTGSPSGRGSCRSTLA